MKKLNLDLFDVGFIFRFKENKHLVIKSYTDKVLCINLDWDDCEMLEDIDRMFNVEYNELGEIIYTLSYINIEEDRLSSKDGLRLLVDDGVLEGQYSLIDSVG